MVNPCVRSLGQMFPSRTEGKGSNTSQLRRLRVGKGGFQKKADLTEKQGMTDREGETAAVQCIVDYNSCLD